MKKLLSSILVLAVICSASVITVSAASGSSDITPYCNNIFQYNSTFIIDDNGDAEICVSYKSDPGVVTNATIEIRLLRKTLLFFWSEVETWTDTSTSSIYSNVHTTSLSKTGTYKVEITYTINGNGGAADVITDEIEQKY